MTNTRYCVKRLCYVVVLRLLLNWSTGFAAFHATLLAQIKVFFFAFSQCIRCFSAYLALFFAAGFTAEGRYEFAAFLGVFHVKRHTVRAHKEAQFSGQYACSDVFESAKRLFAELLAA
jgi:hypothetical protein